MTPSKESVLLEGPAGPLEAILERSGETSPRFLGLCCHPHPLHQGTMLNKVVHTLARSCLDQGGVALRFNYRGVGKSAGTYADGIGETEDAIAMLRELRARFGDLPVVLCGFSFGAGVVLRAALEHQPALLVTVAPPAGRLRVPDSVELKVPWLLVQGLADEVVSSADVLAWAERQPTPPTLFTLKDVGHFFHGSLTVVRAKVSEFIETNLPS